MNQTMRDVDKIVKASSAFTSEMLVRMLEMFDDGIRGWDDIDNEFWNEDFEKEILARVQHKLQTGAVDNEVDIANYMMILRFLRGERAKRQANVDISERTGHGQAPATEVS